ncbi:cryptochrome photolyase family 1 [Chaetoceros tenuissimus]|uniref:Cryptochrome photolyase family 1 n=1 Tax=Chaetoceros tenuissimus TaxID=426638 RepID=A0AAD3CFX4_9STRA|nr:cryptochrome photolyase family 1 [Chaetoceros tenuissimus]
MAKKQSSTSDKHAVSVHWFRNGLRLHDNPCLLDASKSSETVLPLYIIDPEAPFAQTENRGAGAIRANFVLQSIQELNEKFEKNNQRLVVLLGKPEEVLPKVIETVDANALYYEKEPAAPIREMDRKVLENINCDEVEICGYETHTLHPMEKYLAHCKDGVAPSTYGVFTKIFNKLTVPVEVEDVDLESFPALPSGWETLTKEKFGDGSCPSLVALGYEESAVARQGECGIDLVGGEDAGIALLNKMMKRTSWVSTFEKPKTSPNALTVDTTGLSAYVKHGVISPRRFYHELTKVYDKFPANKLSKPPVSLHGQLMWREYNNLMGYTTPNFDKMLENPVARQIPWDDDPKILEAWKNAQTGYPYIDAVMTQLEHTGWIHHLARHSVACFLTRGDLWQSWEKGAEHFEEKLIDADWSINNFNWQWLSCTAHFYQYFRCYSPVAFGKKTDKNGDYIRKWLPQFKNWPAKYIYEPWLAPIAIQKQHGVIIGKDYPEPIVEHKEISKSNMARMKAAYDAQKAAEAASAEGKKKKARK